MIGYWVLVAAVTTDREYDCLTPNPEEAMNWLQHYDHEGASVTVYVVAYGHQNPIAEYEGPEAYTFLEEEIRRP